MALVADSGKLAVEAAAAALCAAVLAGLLWAGMVRLSRPIRLGLTLARLTRLVRAHDPQGAWEAELVSLARRARREPRAVAEEALALFQGRESFDRQVLARAAVVPAVSSLRRRFYLQALALWHATRRTSPLSAVDEGGALRLLVDYGGGCEVWRSGRRYYVRHDAGSHMSCWRQDPISRREAEQALLGPEHFEAMVLELQRRLKARGADLYDGSTRPLPAPELD